MTHRQLERRVLVLTRYVVGLTLALVVLVLGAAGPAATAWFERVDARLVEADTVRADVVVAERIDVVEPDESLALVISNTDRFPGGIFGGTEYPRELSSGRSISRGLLFYNDRGDEVGALSWRHAETDTSYTAGGSLTFDQHRQDQVVQVTYNDHGGRRSAGIEVWDRSTDHTVADLLDVALEVRSDDPAVVAAAVARYRAMQASGGLGARRVFVGSEDRTAEVRLRDTAGRSRIRMYVDSLDVARLEFLDEDGEVVYALP